MTSGQKVAVSLLISVVLFAAFAVAAFAGLFSFVEARFYQPVVVQSIESRLETIAEKEKEYSDTLMQRFSAFAADNSVATYAVARPSDDAQKKRTNLLGTLFSETPALRGIRIVAANGRSVHFSSFATDIKAKTNTQITYKNYGDLDEVPFAAIACADVRSGGAKKYKVTWEQSAARIIYSFPFYDTSASYAGTIAFYCEANDFNRFLISQNLATLGDSAVLASNLVSADGANVGGFVFGLPGMGADVLLRVLIERAEAKKLGEIETVVSTEAGSWIVFSRPTDDGAFVARFSRDDALLFPPAVRVLLLLIVFVTLFLVIFLLFNMRHDDMVVVSDQIRRFQTAFIDAYTMPAADGVVKQIPEDLASQREAITHELKASLGRRGKKHEAEVNQLIDRAWKEMTAALGFSQPALSAPAPDTAELKKMLEEVLHAQQAQTPSLPPRAAEARAAVASLSEVEELADVEEIPEVEELTEIEEIPEVEELADVEEIPEVEELTEIEEIPESEELADVEEIPEVEELVATEELPEPAPADDEFAESLTFGSPSAGITETKLEHAAEDDTFMVAPPQTMFEDLDEKPLPSAEYVAAEENDDIETLPLLEATDARESFSFWQFGINDTPVTELAAESKPTEPPLAPEAKETIVEADDGTYHIAPELSLSSLPLDARFKELVDSVLG